MTLTLLFLIIYLFSMIVILGMHVSFRAEGDKDALHIILLTYLTAPFFLMFVLGVVLGTKVIEIKSD